MAKAVITQNMLNIMNSFNSPVPKATSEAPASFTNKPSEGGQFNVITMAPSSHSNNLYTVSTNENAAKKIMMLCGNHYYNGRSSGDYNNLYYWDYALLNRETYSIFYSNVQIPSFEQIIRPSNAEGAFASDSTSSIRFILAESDEEITQDTTGFTGNYITNGSILSTKREEDGSYTAVFRVTVPPSVPTFTARTLYATYIGGNWGLERLAPVLYWGANLDEPIELEANDSLKITVNFKCEFLA